ncbi:MAG: glycosyltransferase [Hyphomonadaceae bacterium]|nr:glycosyltransferase [Hyphomonadaceae bacterium]
MHPAKYVLERTWRLRELETIHDNVFWRGAIPRISICVPTLHHDVSPLLEGLSKCEATDAIEVIVYDDGSRDHDLLARMQANAGHANAAVRIVSAHRNKGRAAARNAAIAHARADWILMVDADMTPDTPVFLQAYLDAIDHAGRPSIIVGGYSLLSAPNDRAYALHRWQARKSECIPATERSKAPSRYVFSSNVLVHRAVLDACPFDENFTGWGWEDTDWGLNAQKRFPILHIDNTATHLGLDSAAQLMGKYARSGANFARMAARHPEDAAAMPLFRMATRLRAVPFRKSFKWLAADVAKSESFPLALRGRALKTWRALVYAEAL